MKPLVTILINNYNYQSYVAGAIQSALTQTYEHCEVVVVDDGSTDSSREIISSFGDQIRPVFKSNGGQASAFKRWIRPTPGETSSAFWTPTIYSSPRKSSTSFVSWRPNPENGAFITCNGRTMI